MAPLKLCSGQRFAGPDHFNANRVQQAKLVPATGPQPEVLNISPIHSIVIQSASAELHVFCVEDKLRSKDGVSLRRPSLRQASGSAQLPADLQLVWIEFPRLGFESYDIDVYIVHLWFVGKYSI